MPTKFPHVLACIVSQTGTILPIDFAEMIKQGIPATITYSKGGVGGTRSLTVAFKPLINTWFMTPPELYGAKTRFAFKSFDLALTMSFDPSSTGLGYITVAGGDGHGFVKPTGRDDFLAATPSLAFDVNTKGELEYTLGMQIHGACNGTPNEGTSLDDCNDAWNPLGLGGLVKANSGMLKLTFPPGSPYPNAIRAYVNEGRLIGTDEPVTAAISTALKLSDDPSVGGDFAAGLFLHADKLSQASLLRILPASSTSFDSMFKHIEKTLPTLTDVRIYAASVPNVFDEDDFADFKKYFNKNLSYDSQLDLDKPGFKVKAHYSNPLTYGSIVAAAKDVKYNYLYELSDFARYMITSKVVMGTIPQWMPF